MTREMAAAAAASMAADLGLNMTDSAGVPPLSDEQVQALYLRTMELLREQYDVARAENGEGAAVPPGAGGPEAAGPGGPPAGNGLMAQRPQQQQPPTPNRRARRAAAAERRRMQ